MKITGIMFYYYFVCPRKLWHFTKGISLEDESENVMLGRLLDDSSFSKDKKHIMIDETVNVDFIRDWKILHEIKKAKALKKLQFGRLNIIYILKKRGIEIEKGILDYPKVKRREEIFLSKEDKEKIEGILKEIEEIVMREKAPEKINSKICKKCAYYEYCYI